MSHCPSDGKPCCDDLCHNGGCLKTGTEMLQLCSVCKQLINTEDSSCLCDDDEYPRYEAEDDL